MAPTYVKYSGMAEKSCTTVSDCYGAFSYSLNGRTVTSWPQATTAAEKAQRCCTYFGITQQASGEYKNAGDIILSDVKYLFGGSISTSEYTTICNSNVNDNPFTDFENQAGVVHDKATGVYTLPDTLGNVAFKQQCLGSIKLAIASSAAVALLSIY